MVASFYYEVTKNTKIHDTFSVQQKFVNLRDLRVFVITVGVS